MLTQPAKASKSSSHPITRTSTPLERLLSEALVKHILNHVNATQASPGTERSYATQSLRAKALAVCSDDLDVSAADAATVRDSYLSHLVLLELRGLGLHVTYWQKDVAVEAGLKHNYRVRW